MPIHPNRSHKNGAPTFPGTQVEKLQKPNPGAKLIPKPNKKVKIPNKIPIKGGVKGLY